MAETTIIPAFPVGVQSDQDFHVETRVYKQSIVRQVLAHFEADKLSVMIESPVGSGKTIMGLIVLDAMCKRAAGRRLRISWVACRRHLLHQVEALNRATYGLRIQYVSMFDRNPPPCDIIVLDEAHHDATNSVANIFHHSKNTFTLGLSATPLRTDKMKLSFEVTVAECGIGRLIADEYLSPFMLHIIPEWTPALVADTYLSDVPHWGKSIAFFSTIEECREFDFRMNDAGVSCEVVTSKTNKDDQLEHFIAGEVQVIANVAMFCEGLDLPDLKSVFVRDASRLPTIQMAGRGLRLAPGKKHCNIVQSRETKYTFSKLAEPLDTLILDRGKWLSLAGKNEIIERTLMDTIERILASPSVTLPKYFKSTRAKRIKEMQEENRWDWQDALAEITDPELVEGYLRASEKGADTYRLLECAQNWIHIFGNREEARRCLEAADAAAQGPVERHTCDLAWDGFFGGR